MTVNEELNGVREWLIDNIFLQQDLMYNDTVRDDATDLLSVIASLYNMLHFACTGEKYDYFFHWANKIGGWVDDNLFITMGLIDNGSKEVKTNDQ